MSFFGSISFFLLLTMSFVPAITLGLLEKSLQGYRTALSVLVIGLVFWTDKEHLAYLIVFYLLELILVKLYLKLRIQQGENRSTCLYRVFLFLSILPLILCKISEAAGGTALNLFQFLGISYLTFRVVQMLIETYDGIIKEIRWIDFTDFLLLFPTFSCGPIDRSRRYLEDAKKHYSRSEYLELLGDGILSILIGVLYKFVLAALVHRGVGFFQDPQSFLEYAGYSYCYEMCIRDRYRGEKERERSDGNSFRVGKRSSFHEKRAISHTYFQSYTVEYDRILCGVRQRSRGTALGSQTGTRQSDRSSDCVSTVP